MLEMSRRHQYHRMQVVEPKSEAGLRWEVEVGDGDEDEDEDG